MNRVHRSAVVVVAAWRESNPHDQLGRLLAHSGRPLRFTAVTRQYTISTLLFCLFG
jgi:hypothetical protein